MYMLLLTIYAHIYIYIIPIKYIYILYLLYILYNNNIYIHIYIYYNFHSIPYRSNLFSASTVNHIADAEKRLAGCHRWRSAAGPDCCDPPPTRRPQRGDPGAETG